MASKANGKKAKTAPAKAAKLQKGGAIGSLKKMLGLSTKGKGAPSAKAKKPEPAKKAAKTSPVKAKPPVATKTASPAKTGKSAQPQASAAKAKGAASHGGSAKSSGSKKNSGNGSLTSLSLASKVAATKVASGPAVCREVACELVATTGDYCRMHYIKNWKKVKRKEMILKERKLNHYIEELVSKYPDKYIEAIRQDLASEKDFAKVIADLEIEESMDDFEAVETETAEGIIDNLKRDFEDDGDVF